MKEDCLRGKLRARLMVKGIVQGVGFRPFVERFAGANHLAGWVLNSSSGVEIEVEGRAEDVKKFVAGFFKNAPPRSLITQMDVSYWSEAGYHDFIIKKSVVQPQEVTLISPDLAICPDCLAELRDPENRRYNYPFINCTNCGPRYTIIQDIPYDRANTTMKKFKMCSACQAEYRNRVDRRFHAQPNACWDCGPAVWLSEANGLKYISGQVVIAEAKKLLAKGKILAIKGLGGFHLACDAQNEDAVRNLRLRKKREEKPFALMMASMENIKALCFVSKQEEQSLVAPAAAIVLLKKKEPSLIASSVAPKSQRFGVMLPYTPLHGLLLDNAPYLALVMTSGNLSQEPIVISNDQALKRLAVIADYFLFHNRDIYTRSDDSILQVVEGKPSLLRRSRGYCPSPIHLEYTCQEVLACGAELKNTICLTRARNAFVSQYLGDLENLEAFRFFEHTINKMKRILRVDPKIIAHDLHPDYMSTRYAQQAGFDWRIPVQHHHAHVASCMAENGLNEKVIGIAWDGTGYGEDGCIWGGEFLVADFVSFERKAYFSYLPLPGGHMAIKEPYRMALSYLYQAFGEKLMDLALLPKIDQRKKKAIMEVIKKRINSPLTSSVGRLFEAISSLLGIRNYNTFEGQAAMELEAWAEQLYKGDSYKGDSYPYTINKTGGHYQIEVTSMIEQIVKNNRQNPAKIAFNFHLTLAEIAVSVCHKIREEYGITRVVLSGGVFQNRLLTSLLSNKLIDQRFDCHRHWKVPPNDGGISLGQAVIANFRANNL